MTSPEPATPPQPSLAHLRELIAAVAAGRVGVGQLIANFRPMHEAVERQGRPAYASKEEARLIWDVLWVLEFYSPNPAAEATPREWHDEQAVLAEVQRVAQRLQELAADAAG